MIKLSFSGSNQAYFFRQGIGISQEHFSKFKGLFDIVAVFEAFIIKHIIVRRRIAKQADAMRPVHHGLRDVLLLSQLVYFVKKRSFIVWKRRINGKLKGFSGHHGGGGKLFDVRCVVGLLKSAMDIFRQMFWRNFRAVFRLKIQKFQGRIVGQSCGVKLAVVIQGTEYTYSLFESGHGWLRTVSARHDRVIDAFIFGRDVFGHNSEHDFFLQTERTNTRNGGRHGILFS